MKLWNRELKNHRMDSKKSPLKPTLKSSSSNLIKNPALAHLKDENYRNSFIMNFGLKSSLNNMSVPLVDIEVNQKDGPFYTISSAIEAAGPNSTIYIHSGLYSEKLVITTPGLKLVPKSRSEQNDIILLNGDGASILIDIPDGGKCEISNFKIANTAKSDLVDQNAKQKNQIINAFTGLGR